TANGELIAFNTVDEQIKKYAPGFGPLIRIYEDRSGKLWIEPEKSNVVKFDPLTGKFSIVKTDMASSPQNDNASNFKVFEDLNGIIWINTKGNGFGYYDEPSGKLKRIPSADRNMPFPKLVDFAFYDSSGVFWVKSDRRGIIKVTLQPDNFRKGLLMSPELRSESEVRSVYRDRLDRLWMGTKSGDIFVLGNNKRAHPVFSNISSNAVGSIYSIYEDDTKRIWMGSKTNGIYIATADGASDLTYSISHYRKSAAKDGLAGNQIYSITADKYGNIWLGSFDGGLMKVVETAGGISIIKDHVFLKNYPKTGFNKIRHLHFDRFGNLWIGTTDGLVIMYGDSNAASPKFLTYRKLAAEEESLGDNGIQDIYEDSENRIWLATSGGGVALARGESIEHLKFRNYTVKDGLANDFVLSMVEDDNGNLWFATENGLSKFNYTAGKFVNYNFYDGLPAASFSEGPGAKDGQGNVYFGMSKGYLYFNPQNFYNNRIQGILAFTNLQINNKNAGPETKDNHIEKDVNYLHKLVLNYDQNVLRLSCALLDYRFTDKELLSYRLKGFDSTWYNTSQNTQITYTNLPAGEYLLEIKALRKDLYKNAVFRTLPIIVRPAPWKTWWAYTLYTIAAIIIIVIVSRTLLTMLKLKHNIELEKKLTDLKLNFFTNVSHELRTPLTLILGPAEQLSKKEQLSAEGKGYIEVIKKSAARMAYFVNQLLDLRKLQAGSAKLNLSYIDVIGLVKNCGLHFRALAESKNICFSINAPSENLYAYVDGEKIDTVVYNLLSNAFKYTPEGKAIEVLIEFVDSNAFAITVADEGPGVKPENLSKIFDLFSDINELNNKIKGTGIGLALCRELVELHKGEIAAVNRNTVGLAVTFLMGRNVNAQTEQEVSTRPVISDEKSLFAVQEIRPDLPRKISLKEPLVLMVEDNPDLNSFIKRQLSEFYRVETAFDGKEGLEKALAIQPDIIVSDIMMPNMDGITMLDKLKNNRETSHIPVILLTAKSSVESQIEGLNYGADYYIPKPFSSDFLMASVKNLIRQRTRMFERIISRKTADLKPEKIVITSKDEEFLKRVVKIVSDNMDDPAFNIEATAAQLNMTHNTFYKKFKSLTNLTPVEFVRDIRLQRANEYLETGEYNVSEVAYMTGFSNPKYFSTCFKAKYNTSPSCVPKSR
ncbi:MAG TPA: two-component regulator propeller domain-containing protein, partial [Arachidicoccus sp.]|nr:two-component regulator propeller domain-containing protein [Arachidicoccus sp.]